jgi:dihydropteroate synthase
MTPAAGAPAGHPAGWQCGATRFDLTARALVMGVVNVTPDSFSDGGRFLDPEAALTHARALLDQGADLIDLGAESTRPGSDPVAPEEQWRRLAPVLEPLARIPGACVSVDTASAWVAERAVAAGAKVVNDVSALGDSEMAGVVAQAGAGLILMHMRGEPRTMQADPHFQDVRREVSAFLIERARAAEAAGVAKAAIALDPGIGFGKTLAHNLALLAGVGELAEHGYPVVIGASRKSFLGRLLDHPVEDRLAGGLAIAAITAFAGARIVRTHDVAATLDAVKVAAALRGAR